MFDGPYMRIYRMYTTSVILPRKLYAVKRHKRYSQKGMTTIYRVIFKRPKPE